MTKAILETNYLTKSELSPWGNSIGFRIPKIILDLLGLKKGSKVNVFVRKNQLIIEKDMSKSEKDFWEAVDKFDIKDFAKKINKHNKRAAKEFETKPVGKEVW